MFISVTAGGVVSGNVPEVQTNYVPEAPGIGHANYYPAYNYTDMIGGEGTLVL
jgi:hypothetical protein